MQTAFNGGEFSPRLEGRVDLQRYASSCKVLKNFIPTIAGPAEKRPGTHFVVNAIGADSKLVPFEFSIEQAYVVEFGVGRCRFHRNEGVVLDPGSFAIDNIVVGATTQISTTASHGYLTGDTVFVTGVTGTLGPRINNRFWTVTQIDADDFTIPFNSTGLTHSSAGTVRRVYEIENPYVAGDLPNLVTAQSADVLYIACPTRFPRKLLRFADDNWTMVRARGFQLGNKIPIVSITQGAAPVLTLAAAPVGEPTFSGSTSLILTEVQGMRELNGAHIEGVLADDTVMTSFTEVTDSGFVAVNSTNFHQFDGAGAVSKTGFAQKIISWDWPAFSAENTNDAHLMVFTDENFSDPDQGRKGHGGFLASSQEIDTTNLNKVTYLKLRERSEENYPKWEARTNFNDAVVNDIIGAAGLQVGDFVHFEGNVYELINKNGESVTGYSPPAHIIEEERQLDHKWTWEFAHQGDCLLELRGTDELGFVLQCTVRRRVPFGVQNPSIGDYAAGVATSTAADPVVITDTAHGLVDGDRVLLMGFTTATELNGLLVYVNQLDANTFEIHHNRALTAGVDGTSFGAGASGSWVKMNSGTPRWSLEAWSTVNGFPRAVAFFEDRLWWAGTVAEPQTIWASETGNYDSHDAHDEIAGALVFSLNDQNMNAIDWLYARRGRLVLGTRGGEFLLTGQNPEEPISSENPIRPQRMTAYGTQDGVQPVQIGSSILFAQRSGRSIREFVYDEQNSDEYRAPDMSLLAHHLFLSAAGISQLAWQHEPYSLLWAVTGDLELRACVFDRTQDVTGWSRQVLGGAFAGGDPEVLSVAVIPHPDGDQDQIWMIVRRDGGVFVEFMEKPFREGGTLATEAWYVDAGLFRTGAPATLITGLDHLEGKVVHALADGVFRGPFTVTGGAVTLPVAATNVIVGLPYEAELETHRIEAGGADGPAQGKFKNIRNVVVRLDQTGSGFFYGRDEGTMDRLPMRTGTEATALAAVTLLSGDTRELALPGDNDALGRVRLEHREPLPCTVVGLVAQLQVEDD